MCEVWKSNANGCEKQRQLSPRSVKTWSCESHLRHNVEAKIPTPHQRSHTLENVGTFWLHHRDESHQAIRDRPNAAHYLHFQSGRAARGDLGSNFVHGARRVQGIVSGNTHSTCAVQQTKKE
mmetsp:Transcript_21606/g.34875  ORF Transcript_21606/g.34875 Transcript_21606/m.34875 type:complete len:122 (-) Transcript_21606:827-1192(-)